MAITILGRRVNVKEHPHIASPQPSMIALDASFRRGSRGAREGVARETLRELLTERGGEGGCGRHHGVADRVDTGVSGCESAPNA